jgi:hypothetical protein
MFVANNNKENMLESEETKNYEEYAKYLFGSDFFTPCATNLLAKNNPMPWEGKDEEKPEIDRCFRINIK